MIPRLIVAALVAAVLVLRPALLGDLAHSPRAWAVSAGIVAASALARRLLSRRAPAAASWVAAAVTLGLFAVVAAPAFRERTLHEAFPAVAAPVADVVPEPARARVAPVVPATAPPVVPSPKPVATLLSAGQLDGLGGHHASGRVATYRVGQDAVLRFEDVDITGGARPSVHLVPPGQQRPEGGLRLGALKAEHGSFSYPVPSTADLTWSVLVWCDPYHVPIGAADLH